MGHAAHPRAQLLYDESPGAGLGHRRRMEALAMALAERGWRCRIAPVGEGARPAPGYVTVVDSYEVRADELTTDDEAFVVAVDDLYRDLAVDVLVDPSPGALEETHRRARRVLAGAEFALVDEPRPRARPISVRDPVHRVLVTTDAADACGIGACLARAIRPVLRGVQIRLVLGTWGSADVPEGVIAVRAPSTLADEMAAAPIVVTAGGIAMLEACRLGRAVIAVVVAEHQRTALAALAAAGAVLAVDPERVAEAVTKLASDATRRQGLADAAQQAIDGRGPSRVAAVIDRLGLPARSVS